MKTILYNTTTNQTVGKIREGYYNGIWNSALSKEAGWTPEHIVELEVIQPEEPAYNPSTQKIASQWVVDIEEFTYTLEWTVTDKTQAEIDYEAAVVDWIYLEWAKRIVAPIELILDDVGIKMYGWFQLNGFPVEKVDDTTLHLYCNVILPQHQAIVDGFGEAVTIEDRPQVLGLKIKVL